MEHKARVRFAPSPTGDLHVGNARTALFNWMFARREGGCFILRIEDTDESRSDSAYQTGLLEDLKWLGLDWDEGPDIGGAYGPYRQSERLDLYAAHLKKLMDADLAYPCYCTEEELEEERRTLILARRMPRYSGKCRNLSEKEREALAASGRKPSYRFKVPRTTIEFHDLIRGPMRFEGEAMGDFIIVRSNGMPAYNFAVVIDDHDMAISHVIRGDDHIANTPKQLMVYEALGWEAPEFGHMTLIINSETGKKLSKRDTNTLQFIEDYRKKGYMPEAVFNFIALLGWNPGGEEEIFSREELIQLFDENRLSKSPAAFDQKKMDWMSNDYLKNADFEKVFELCKPFLEAAGRLTDKAEKLVELYKPQLKSADEIVPLTDLFFADFPALTEAEKEVMAAETVPTVLQAFKAKLEALTDEEFVTENIFPQIKAVQKETGIKGKNLFMPIRIAVSGEMHGPELPDTIYLLGREKSIQHLENMLETIQ